MQQQKQHPSLHSSPPAPNPLITTNHPICTPAHFWLPDLAEKQRHTPGVRDFPNTAAEGTPHMYLTALRKHDQSTDARQPTLPLIPSERRSDGQVGGRSKMEKFCRGPTVRRTTVGSAITPPVESGPGSRTDNHTLPAQSRSPDACRFPKRGSTRLNLSAPAACLCCRICTPRLAPF